MAVTTLSIFRKTLRPVIFLIINKQLYRKQIRRSLAIKWHLKVKIYGSSNFGYFLGRLSDLLSFGKVLYGECHCLDTAIILSGFLLFCLVCFSLFSITLCKSSKPFYSLLVEEKGLYCNCVTYVFKLIHFLFAKTMLFSHVWIFCHIFLRNYAGYLSDYWDRPLVWGSNSCKVVSSSLHFHFMSAKTWFFFLVCFWQFNNSLCKISVIIV